MFLIRFGTVRLKWKTGFMVAVVVVEFGTFYSTYIYVIYRIGGPYRRNISRGLKNGQRPKAVFKTEGNISLYGPTIPVNNIFILIPLSEFPQPPLPHANEAAK